ncbi:MAG: CotH kinase family protein [Bacteroidales bacterium]|nr:CotH kinase family protein [Bacteroidales bacterium]
MKRITLIVLAALSLICLASCTEKEPEFIEPGGGIISFALLKADNPTLIEDVICTVNNQDSTITGMFPELLDDYRMIPTFELDCEYLACDGRLQLSGVNVQDFANVITYEAKMKDGSIRRYTVKMSFPVKPDLPVISIKTVNGQKITDKKNYIKGTVTISDPSGLYWDTPELVLEMTKDGIRGRGNTTWDMPKKPYKLKFDEKVSIFGLPKDKEWVILANYADKSLLRNVVAMKLSEIVDMEWTPAMLPVEVYLNDEYLGCYTFSEHKKVSSGRVNLDIVSETDNTGDLVTGDYYFEIESRQDETTCFLSAVNHIPMMFCEPEVPTSQQLKYVTEYFRDAELALNSADFTNPSTGWQKYIDIESFAKTFIVNELTKNIDGNMRKSSFMSKKRGKKLEMIHLWDYDLTLGNCDYIASTTGGMCSDGPEGWFIKVSAMDQGISWFIRLCEDPAFCAEVKRIWNEIYPQLQEIPYFIDRQARLIDDAQVRNFERWDILDKYVWPNKVVTGKYSSEVAYLKDFYTKRLEWMNAAVNVKEGEIFR